MSVRRLAEEAVQPQGFAFSNDNASWAERKIAEYPAGRQASAVIPLLMRAQEQEGWISRPAIESIARMLGMPYIRVLEVATFYTQFQLKPVGTRAHIQVCGTTPCMLRGAEALRSVCQHKIHHDPHTTNAAGTLSWEEVECLGACVNAPMIAIFQDTYEDLTPNRLEEIIDAFGAGQGAGVPTGPQTKRVFSAPSEGRTTLIEAPTAKRNRPTPLVPPAPPAAAPATGAPPAAPAAATPAPAPAAPQAPTTAGRVREISEEAAPAIKGPAPQAKVSEATAETARKQFDSQANGEPGRAMRPEATGAESAVGKIAGGKAAGKTAPPQDEAVGVAAQQSPTVEKGGSTPLFAAPEGARDDLKLITGVGPVLERTLNGLGITTWKQVAVLTPEQITAVEARLNFKGRVARDRWIEQAEALAAGGVAEYIKRFGKDPR